MPIAACLRWSLLAVVAFPPDSQADCQPQQQTICCDVMVPSYERTRETECPALAAIVSCTTDPVPNRISSIKFLAPVAMGKVYSLWLDLAPKSGGEWRGELDGVSNVFDAVGSAGVVEVVGVI